jgi:hypothetical protein
MIRLVPKSVYAIQIISIRSRLHGKYKLSTHSLYEIHYYIVVIYYSGLHNLVLELLYYSSLYLGFFSELHQQKIILPSSSFRS